MKFFVYTPVIVQDCDLEILAEKCDEGKGGAITENGKFHTLDTFNYYFIHNIILREL